MALVYSGMWSTAAWTGLTFWKRFNRGTIAKAAKGRLKQRAANYRHVVHHSSCDIPSETQKTGGMERLYRPRNNTGRHLWGDGVSLWNHGPTGWAQIDRVTYEPSGLPACVSVCSQHPCVVPLPPLQSRMAKSGVFWIHPAVSLWQPWCYFSADDAPSLSATPPPSPSPLFHSRWPLSNSSDVPLHV